MDRPRAARPVHVQEPLGRQRVDNNLDSCPVRRRASVLLVVGDPRNPSAIWRYQFHPTKGGGTRLVESFEFGSGPSGTSARIAEVPDKEEYVVAARTAEHSQNMLGTLHAIKAEAEKQV